MVRALRNHDDLEDLRRKMPFHAGTLAKGMMILQAFLRDPRPHANSELSELLGLPRPTVSRLCQTLLELGYLDLDERSDRYFIGPAAVAIGYPYIVSAPLRLQARPAMQALADQIRGAVSMGVAMDLDVVYLETSAWQRGTLARPDVGAVRAVAETAMGRAWLASLPPREQATLLRRLRNERPDQMARCAAGIEASLAGHAVRGFAVNEGDAGLSVQGVGVASRLRHGSRRLLFNCALPGTQIHAGDLIKRVGPRLVELVRVCERNAGLA